MAYTFATDTHFTLYRNNLLLILYSVLFAAFWVYTGFHTPDPKNWWMENTLTASAVILLVVFYRYFQFSDFGYTCLFLFMMLHVYGSQYTYADNPFGFWVQEELDLKRNHYDRLVHFSFGLLLAYPMHEIFWRVARLRNSTAYLLPVELTISLGAIYELAEWAVADIFFPKQGMAFLGMQGDIWDAQKDIFVATVGALLTMGTLYLWHHGLKKRLPFSA